jgi:predicted GNAT superfamily acetyltransferase
MPDYRDVVPANLLATAIKNGGILVGAFDGARMVGFAFGILGSEERGTTRRLKHTSHMLAVLPENRAGGLGARLKWEQRAQARRQGLDLMTWTYDPLQALNAQLNLNRLGAIARRYYRNVYGEMTDALNAGVASDRFEVEWELSGARAVSCHAGTATAPDPGAAPAIYKVNRGVNDLPAIVAEAELTAATILVEIPSDYNALKARDLGLAREWRERTRSTFERAFALGFVATGVTNRTDAGGHSRVFYILERDPSVTANAPPFGA